MLSTGYETVHTALWCFVVISRPTNFLSLTVVLNANTRNQGIQQFFTRLAPLITTYPRVQTACSYAQRIRSSLCNFPPSVCIVQAAFCSPHHTKY